jgi:hypothetical protein
MSARRKYSKPTCPSCGQPIGSGFPLVKTVLAVLLVGYIIVSAFLLRMSMPPEMRRVKTPTSFDSWLQPLSGQPIFQIIVMGGFVAGLLVFYWDWFESLYKTWREKRGDSPKPPEKKYRYKCRSCGWEWS